MGTEDWILKGTELVTNTKKQRLKIQRLDSQNTIFFKKISKAIKKYEILFKIGSFLQGNTRFFK